MTPIPKLDTDTTWGDFEGRVAAVCPDELWLSRDLRTRLGPERWTLEWNLPWLLGRAYGLGDEECAQIVLGNVLGMAALRLEDDLADHEVAPKDRPSAERLSRVLFESAVDAYGQLMPAGSPFWHQLQERMADWRSATVQAAEATVTMADDLGAIDSKALARRGAPLKLSAFAVCELTGRADAYPMLDACLDRALAANVLYDHFCDWESDLEGGRWNSFVDWATARSKLTQSALGIRSRVFGAMMAEGAVGRYFDRIGDELRLAADLAAQADVPALADHLRDFSVRLADHGRIAHAHYDQLGERSMALVFGPSQS